MKYIDSEYIDKIENKYNSGEVISRRKSIYYNGIPNTLSSKVYYVLSEHDKIEWSKCYNDPIYFMEKYLSLKLRKYQLKWINLYKNNKQIIYNISRQTGINTILSALNLHTLIFEQKNILVFSIKLDVSKEYIDIIKKYYYKLPYFLKPNILIWNNNILKFKNSKVVIYNNNVDVSEFNIYQYLDFAFNKQNILTTHISEIISKIDYKIILSSTPNGCHYYYEIYKNSILPDEHPDKNNFVSIKTYWYEVEGRDDIWKEDMIKMIGLESFNKEYNLEF